MEHVPKDQSHETTRKPRMGASRYYSTAETGERPLEIVGYVLGKVDQTLKIPPPQLSSGSSSSYPSSRVSEDDDGFTRRDYSTGTTQPESEALGHVTSLAILDSYRRNGLAGHLMNQLHCHMKERYRADAVGLHVRVSNEAATKLYVQGMGYTIAEVIQGYYQDGEDAFLMRKEFDYCDEPSKEPNGAIRSGTRRWFSSLGGGQTNQWSTSKEMELPRKIPFYKRQPLAASASNSTCQSTSDRYFRDSQEAQQPSLYSH